MTATDPCGCQQFRTHTARRNPWCECGHVYSLHSGVCTVPKGLQWLGHHDLCASSWGSDCDCITPEERAAFCICGYVDGDEGRDPGIRHFEDCPNFENPCEEHNRYPCHKCGQEPRREQVLRRVDDAVEDL